MSKYYNEKEFKKIKDEVESILHKLCITPNHNIYYLISWKYDSIEVPVKRFGFKTGKTKTKYEIKQVLIENTSYSDDSIGVLKPYYLRNIEWYLLEVKEHREAFIKLRKNLNMFGFEIEEKREDKS